MEFDGDEVTIIRDDSDVIYGRSKSDALLVLSPDCIKRPIGVLLPLDDHWRARIANAQRLRAQLLQQKLSDDPLTPQQRQRVSMALRTLDARRMNASYRTIAKQLYGQLRVDQEHWKTSSLKAVIARLSAHGRHLAERGYRSLLLGLGPTGRGKD